jgi:hypothetical protein
MGFYYSPTPPHKPIPVHGTVRSKAEGTRTYPVYFRRTTMKVKSKIKAGFNPQPDPP